MPEPPSVFPTKTGFHAVPGTSETATFRTLIIDELRRHIINYVATSYHAWTYVNLSYESRRTLQRLMLASPVFFHETVGIYWQQLDSMSALLFVLVVDPTDILPGLPRMAELHRSVPW